MKKTILKYLLIAGFFFMIGFFRTYHLPDFKLWAINQIELVTRTNGPVRVLVSDIDFRVFPIGIHFNNIRIYPKKDLESLIEPVFLKSFRISLNPLSFLTGLFQFSRVEFVEPLIRVKSSAKLLELLESDPNKKTNFVLKNILRIPLNNFTIRNMDLYIPPSEKFPTLHLQRFSVDLENQKNSILISVLTPHLMVFDPKISELPAIASIGMRALVFDDQILLSALKVQKGLSYLLASGYLQTSLNDIQFEDYLLKIKSNLDFADLKTELTPFFKTIKLPEVYGRGQSLLTISKKKQDPMHADFKFMFDELSVDKFKIGTAIGKLGYLNDQIKADEIEIRNKAGIIRLEKLYLQTKDSRKFNATIVTKSIQLQEALKNLGIGDVPVQLLVNTSLPCEGALNSKTIISCKGSVDLKNLRIYNNTLDIVTAQSGQLQGTVEVTTDSVVITSDIQIGANSKGKALGGVSFTKGFKFEYSADNLNFSDFTLANLGLVGSTKLSGTTQGDSDYAVFDMNLKALDFGIKDFFLGDIMTRLSYKSGKLYLADVDGLVRATKYLGNVQVDLRKDKVQGQIKAPYIELSDLKKVFAKKVELPFEFYGGGEATTSFSGPLDFPRMSYDLKSQILNGNVANESFDRMIFNVTSKDGHVKATDIQVKKGSGVMKVTGTAEPNGNIDTTWTGANFTLQNINTFAKTELNIDGNLDFELNLKGPILTPDSLFKGKVTSTTLSQESVPDSQFELIFNKKSVDGSAKVFGEQINAQFKIPFSNDTPLFLDMNVKKWDFVPLIHLISSKSRAAEFTTSLTADFKIQSDKDFLWNSTGTSTIKELEIQRGTKGLKLLSPVDISLRKGHISFEKMILTGDNTSLDIQSQTNNQYHVDIGINGKLDLGMLSFLTPFFDDMRGTAALTTQFRAKPDDWSLFGSAFITNGYIRVPDFPHAVESIETDLLFSDDKVVVNKFTSQFASGRIQANGNLEIKGMQNIKTDLYGKFKEISLVVPKDIATKGSGDFRVTGNWFPYKMEGNYIIQSGLITKDFSENNSSSESFMRTQLLPKGLSKEVKEVVIFDYDAVFTKGIDIKNDLIDSKVYGKLKIKGPPTSSIVLGQIQLQRNSKIYFKDTEFEVETADLKFNDSNKINPELYISANTTVTETMDTTSQRYEINMLIQGKASNPTINLTSNPPRSDKDIISLLALGVTTESYQSNTDQNQLAKQSYEVGASILTKNKFGRDLKQKTGFEFKVSSALDQTNNSTVPKVTISKQWTPRIETSASRTFGESSTNDVKVEYQLNKNFSLIGSWEGRELSNTNLNNDTNEKTTTDILGLDIEYKLEFK